MSKSPVEIADRYSRKRAAVVALAALAFLTIYVVLQPLVFAGPQTAHYARAEVMWAANAVILLAGLATGGGLLNSSQIRSLVNDDVARSHYRTAVVAGYWVAMATAMALYIASGLVRGLDGLTARTAVFIIVTSSIVVALLTFSYLEYRAHRDG